jgi:hypothetical protein
VRTGAEVLSQVELFFSERRVEEPDSVPEAEDDSHSFTETALLCD